MKWLIFSKDRPYQLDACIRTLAGNGGIPSHDISVLYHYTGEYEDDVSTLKSEHPDVNFIKQANFRDDVLEWLRSASSSVVSFATDDAIITRHIPVEMITDILDSNEGVTTFSLRMGLHLEHCYPTNTSQKLPDGQVSNGVFVWTSANAEGDWSYILSVDSHVMRRKFVLAMFESFNFSNPNTLESNWQAIRGAVSPIACCLPKSCYVNTPLNLVQDVYNNRCGSVDVKALQAKYREGIRHDISKFREFMNISAHQELVP